MEPRNDHIVLSATLMETLRFGRQTALKESTLKKSSKCVVFTGKISKQSGYGIFYIRGVQVSAHRVAKLWETGHAMLEYQCAHKCKTKSCVNVNHLYWATSGQNEYDKHKDCVRAKTTGRLTNKLSRIQVIEIWERLRQNPNLCTEIAKLYGVSSTNIVNIKKRKRWISVTDNLVPLPYDEIDITQYPPIKRSKRRPISKEESEIIVRMLNDGKTLTSVGRHCDASSETVKNVYMRATGYMPPTCSTPGPHRRLM